MRGVRLGLVTVLMIGTFAVVSGAGVFSRLGEYEVSAMLDSGTGVVEGGPVRVDGFKAGEVTAIEVVDGKAKVTFTLDSDTAPLHDGATATIGWKAVLSERQLEIADGPEDGAAVPDGGMLRGTSGSPVEVADVLAALDEPTRERLKSTLNRLSSTLDGSEEDVRATLSTAGPALEEVSSVLKAIGTDGPAIKNLVTRLDALMTLVAARDDDVATMVTQLDTLTGEVATRRKELRSALTKLPGTLDTATKTLDDVPATVDDVVPLLQDLQPATSRLRTTAQDLRPLLRDLRPLTEDLQPTLVSARSLLGRTPGLLDQTHVTVPQLTTLVKTARKPVNFLRPYTPEVTAFFSTWASAFANYDSNGNFARIHGQAGSTSLNENPGVVPPGITYDPYPEPGALVGETWTDAEGSELR